MSPLWGFKTFGHPVCYKHVAPLGIKTGNTRPLYIWHSSGREQSTYRYYGHTAPLERSTAINMSPRWG